MNIFHYKLIHNVQNHYSSKWFFNNNILKKMNNPHCQQYLAEFTSQNTPSPTMDKYQSDHKGRFMGTHTVQPGESSDNEHPITSLYWSRINPLNIVVCVGSYACVWSLAKSDLRALSAERALYCVGSDRAMALLTPEGEVQVYKLTDDGHNYMELFQKYVALL